jgi:hypothetical protein
MAVEHRWWNTEAGHPVDVRPCECPAGGRSVGLGRRIWPPVAVDLMPSGALPTATAVLIGVQATAALDVGGWTLNNGGDHRLRLQVRCVGTSDRPNKSPWSRHPWQVSPRGVRCVAQPQTTSIRRRAEYLSCCVSAIAVTLSWNRPANTPPVRDSHQTPSQTSPLTRYAASS